MRPINSIDTDTAATPNSRRYAVLLGLQLALHHGRLGDFALTSHEAHLARHHIDRLEREIAASDVRQAA